MIFVGGQFKLELDAQFKSVEGGQYSRNLHKKLNPFYFQFITIVSVCHLSFYT